MSRYRPTRPFASLRNLCVYHDLTCTRCTQTSLAPQVGVSQRRISSIARQVRAWVDARLPQGDVWEHPGIRFHRALMLEHQRLEEVYLPFLRSLFRCARDFLQSLREGHAPAELDAAAAGEVRQYERLFAKGLDILRSLADLEAVIGLGPLADEFDRQSSPSEQSPGEDRAGQRSAG